LSTTYEPAEAAVGRATSASSPLAVVRWIAGGILMGMANLVPGISGGTMILIMGLYDAFVSAVADITRFRFARRNIVMLGMIGGAAGLTIVSLARPLRTLLETQPLAMYALFIGMTLGGVPLLWRMIRPLNGRAIVALLVGVAVMIGIASVRTDDGKLTREEKAALKAQAREGEIELQRAYGRDVAAGLLGMAAMVLPGISGAYMLLLIGRYADILGAIALCKESVFSMGSRGDLEALHVLVPVAIGALVGLVGLTNVLKWLLRHHEKATLSFLLGIVLGSVIMLWREVGPTTARDYGIAAAMLVVGLAVTYKLSTMGRQNQPEAGPSAAAPE